MQCTPDPADGSGLFHSGICLCGAGSQEPVQVIEEEEPTEEEKFPFTIAGNGEVEDNITDDSSKEFFTVKTKRAAILSF